VLDLYSYEQEVDLADNDILKMISETDKIILRSRIIGLFSTVTAGTMCKQDGKNDCICHESLSRVASLVTESQHKNYQELISVVDGKPSLGMPLPENFTVTLMFDLLTSK